MLIGGLFKIRRGANECGIEETIVAGGVEDCRSYSSKIRDFTCDLYQCDYHYSLSGTTTSTIQTTSTEVNSGCNFYNCIVLFYSTLLTVLTFFWGL